LKVSVIGSGSFGTALSSLFATTHERVHLWVYEDDVYQAILNLRENVVFMPGLKLPENIIPTKDMEEATKDADVIFIVVPSHVVRHVVKQMKPYLSNKTILVSVAKGIENETNLLMAEVVLDVLGKGFEENVCVLSGPSFAKEVAEKKPTLVVTASKYPEKATFIQKNFSSSVFRIYTSDDLIGVELGGAVKNVIAIAAGMCDGLQLGYNGMAALITRGLAEITRLGVVMGANPLTFKGLSGLGDLVLTCTGALSRNRQVGTKLAMGKHIEEIQKEMRMVAEGVKTSRSVYELSKKYNVSMPISEQVYKIIYEGKTPLEALQELMLRELKFEREYLL